MCTEPSQDVNIDPILIDRERPLDIHNCQATLLRVHESIDELSDSNGVAYYQQLRVAALTTQDAGIFLYHHLRHKIFAIPLPSGLPTGCQLERFSVEALNSLSFRALMCVSSLLFVVDMLKRLSVTVPQLGKGLHEQPGLRCWT